MLGDVVVQAAGAVTLVDSRTQGDKATHLPSVHGSQTALEMDIPCLIDMADSEIQSPNRISSQLGTAERPDLRLAGLAGASCSVAADSAARSCSVATSCALGPLRMVLSETLSEPALVPWQAIAVILRQMAKQIRRSAKRPDWGP